MQPTACGRGWYRGAQEFEDSAVAARIRHIVEPANEQMWVPEILTEGIPEILAG